MHFFRIFTVCAMLVGPPGAFADVPTEPADERPTADAAAAQALVAAAAAAIPTDIGIPPAEHGFCPLSALPSNRAGLLPLLPPGHRRLIAEGARGRMRVRRGVHGFDLLALLEDPVEATAEAAKILAFFDARKVDVAVGSAVSEDAYPISFDWVVVLDAEARTLFSFILNCRD